MKHNLGGALIHGRPFGNFSLDVALLNSCPIGVSKSFGFARFIVDGESEIVSQRGNPDWGRNWGAITAVRHERHIFGGSNRVVHESLKFQ
jgi:hypothetical protein